MPCLEVRKKTGDRAHSPSSTPLAQPGAACPGKKWGIPAGKPVLSGEISGVMRLVPAGLTVKMQNFSLFSSIMLTTLPERGTIRIASYDWAALYCVLGKGISYGIEASPG